MSSHSGKPSHCFNEFVHVKKDVKVNQSNYLAVCWGCVTVKGWTWAEAEVRKINMSNTVPSIGKHLSVCENFKMTYPDRVEYVKENIETRKQRTAELRTANNLKRQLNQLPELDEEDDNLSQASFSTRSTVSTSTSGTSKRLCTNNSEKVQSTINQYIRRKLLPNEIDTFYRLLLRMTISNGWAFQWVENQETIEFFNFISLLLKLPNQKTLADEILKNSAERVQNNIEAAAKDDKYGIRWTSINMGAKDISGDRGNTDAAVRHISAFLNETQAKNIKINTVITDSASSYNAARKQLRCTHNDIVFLPCFAHQANLCVADVLKSSPKLLETSKNATAIVKYFNASSKFTKDLRDEQKRIYNKYITLIQPGQTRRNDLSDVTVVHEEEEGNNDNKLMASKIISIIDNPDFWINLVELEKILYPYCAALNLLQKDKARLYDVLHFFGYFMQCTSEYPKLSHINLNKWVQYYYIKWFGNNSTSMVQELLAYKENFFPFNEPSLLELEQTPLDYWSFLSDSVPELSQIATKLFSICVNSASCERLFSTMGFLHTKRRNKLHYSKVLWMAQIRGELQREKFIKSIILDDQRVNNNRIAVPVGDEEIDDSIMKPPELDVDDIDDKSDNGNDDEVDEFIKLWFEGLNEKDISEDDTPDNEINENLNKLLSTQIHPADNNDAKWDLTTLFKSQLVAPSFFSNMSL
ncbi:unnamed protein product [Rhizophagus irregularis]|nr:unnamed protein product [Rhizophagus irregularis]